VHVLMTNRRLYIHCWQTSTCCSCIDHWEKSFPNRPVCRHAPLYGYVRGTQSHTDTLLYHVTQEAYMGCSISKTPRRPDKKVRTGRDAISIRSNQDHLISA